MGKGIVQAFWWSESGSFQGFLLTCNSNKGAAEAFQNEFLLSEEENNAIANLKVHVVHDS
jgi:hypothetical protein